MHNKTPKTITVRHVNGTTFTAPAKGKVMERDYQPTEEQMEAIVAFNSGPPVIEEGYADAIRAIKKIEAENQKYYRSLPKWYEKKNRKANNNSNISTRS